MTENNSTETTEKKKHQRFEVTEIFENGKELEEKETKMEEPGDFEVAIAATGYGWFNVVLLFSIAVLVPSSQSYGFTSAQCDLKLSVMDMGTVNAVAYRDYLSDTLGRRRCMGWGFIATGLFELVSALTQNFSMLLTTRFISGFM